MKITPKKMYWETDIMLLRGKQSSINNSCLPVLEIHLNHCKDELQVQAINGYGLK